MTIDPYFFDSLLIQPSKFSFPNSNDSVQIEKIALYITDIQLLANQKTIWKEPNSIHLVQLENAASRNIPLSLDKEIRYDAIRFTIGIDSLTNVSGAIGGDLDPTKGMYWTWQSGYINIKLEGHSTQSLSKDHSFAYHIGGYKKPFVPLQTITLPIKNSDQLTLKMDIGKWLEQIDISKRDHIMSPGANGLRAAQFLPSIFSVR